MDVTSALKADPARQRRSPRACRPGRATPARVRQGQERLSGFVGSGQLGIFTNGYWGHPAMKLPPEVEPDRGVATAGAGGAALRQQDRLHPRLQDPHIQNVAVGGVANPLAVDAQSVLTVERLMAIRGWIDKLEDFVKNVYLVDVAAIGAFYPNGRRSAAASSTTSPPRHPARRQGRDLRAALAATSPTATSGKFPDPQLRRRYLLKGVSEAVKHSWYEYKAGDAASLHPYEGETAPVHRLQDEGKYSWLKSPTLYGKADAGGPLARVLTMLAAGHEPTKKYATETLARVSSIAGIEVGLDAMHSTIGRHAARAVSCAVQVDELARQWDLLLANMAKGDLDTFNAPASRAASSAAWASTRHRAASCRTGW